MIFDVSVAAEQMMHVASAAPAMAAMMCNEARTSAPTLMESMMTPASMDCLTGMGLYYLGQRVKGVISKTQPSWDVLMRWMAIGIVDGFSSHQWYEVLEQFMSHQFPNSDHWFETVTMATTSTFGFTPLYCAGFLGLLSLLEGKGIQGAADRLKEDYFTLVTKTIQTWGLFNVGLFGFVALEHRVTVTMTFHFFYLIGLALWNEGYLSVGTQKTSAANVQQQAQSFQDINPGLRLAVSYHPDGVMNKGVV